MNYFNSLSEWIEQPLTEFNIELATLNIDQIRNIYSDRGNLSQVFINDYTAHWLAQVFNQIQKKNSLVEQTETEQGSAVERGNYEFLKKLNAVFKLKKRSADFVIAFITGRDKIKNNEFLKKVKTYCKTNHVYPNLHSAQIMELAGKSVEFERGNSRTLVFPLEYDEKYFYDSMAVEYINNLTSLHLSSLKESKSKKFLIAFEFVKHFKKVDKERFFRSVIRSFAQLHFDRHSINFNNISVLVDSEEDVRLFNSAVSDIIYLLEYNSSKNDWGEFYFNHPFIIASKPISDIESLTNFNIPEDARLMKYKNISVGSLTHKILQDINTSDQEFIKELMVVDKIIDAESSILLLGETGVGKSFLAKEIYKASSRKNKNPVTVNCSAIPETLIESELFGYEKGSHDKAFKERNGYIEQANGGILFLDEIGKAPLSVQQKLLLVLDDKEFYRLGGIKPVTVDVKIIFATNSNLKELMKRGEFLPEFFYRISEFPITIPPLRKRREDIEKFLHIYKNEYKKLYEWKGNFGEDEITVLKNYTWPGNIRELKSVVQDLIVRNSVFGGEITEREIKDSVARFTTETHGLELLEMTLLDLFTNWLSKKEQIVQMVETELRKNSGKEPRINEISFGRSVIEPILANIYAENFKSLGLIQTAASENIGMSWSGPKGESTLPQKLKLYPIVEDFFK